MLKTVVLLAILSAGFLLCGCSSLGVRPWQRGILAKPEMSLQAQPLMLSVDDHIYFAKEGTSGGRDFAGGGCGCNG